MSHLASIYAVWGDNAEAMATDIGESGVLTRQWRNRGNIPSKYWPRIIAEAAKRGVELAWTDFIEPSLRDAANPSRPSPPPIASKRAAAGALSEAAR